MKSPFPGMDPYIEACGLWGDFHNNLIAEIKRGLAATLPEKYIVRGANRSYVVLATSDGKEEHAFIPDAGLSEVNGSSQSAAVATAVAERAIATASVRLRAFIDEHFREQFVEIYETEPEQRLVTCIEVLSPSNKKKGTEGWDLYLRQRQALLLGSAHLVEIDLLRGGARMPMLDPLPDAPYYTLVCRKEHAPYCDVCPAHWSMPLSALSIPLSHPDPNINLPLQSYVDEIYARFRYARSIDYRKPLSPPLTTEEQAWLAARLTERSPA